VRIGITEPTTGETPTGNRRQARQWAHYLLDLGYEVELAAQGDALIAFNASKCHEAIAAFREAHPDGPVVVVLTGTDIYPAPDARTLESVHLADRVVALQSRAARQIPAEFHEKLSVILQAAEAPAPQARSTDPFDVAVISHLREVKDPLRAAFAARLLPASSKIHVRLAGDVLEDDYTDRVEHEVADNTRFDWLGPLSAAAVSQLIAASQLVVVSSFFEGGARVIGESIVAGTPVVAARNDASCSLLGDDYPGLYEAGNTEQLAALMHRAETETGFLDTLRQWIAPLAPQFAPELEQAAVGALLQAAASNGRDRDERESAGTAAGS